MHKYVRIILKQAQTILVGGGGIIIFSLSVKKVKGNYDKVQQEAGRLL